MIIDINFVGLIISSIMASAVPLILASCGELITERSGVLNLGDDTTHGLKCCPAKMYIE